MRKKKRKVFIYNYIIVIVFLVLLFIIFNKTIRFNYINNIYNNLLSKVSHKNTKIVYDSTLKEENKKLKEEIKELKEYNNISFDKDKRINSKIINRNYSLYYSYITINKGKKDNIKKNMAVINEKGLVGLIDKVYNHESTINLITNKNLEISAKFTYNDSEYYGIINKYDYENNCLYLSNVIGDFKDGISNIDVVTSGLNTNVKSNIIIGKIISKKSDEFNLSNTFLLKPAININNINYVSVVGEN